MLADELLDTSVTVRLVADDLHLIAESEVHDFVAGLLETAPPALRLAITSRMNSLLPLDQLRLRGVLSELRGEDFLFAAETRLLLDQIPSDAKVAEDDVAGTVPQRPAG